MSLISVKGKQFSCAIISSSMKVDPEFGENSGVMGTEITLSPARMFLAGPVSYDPQHEMDAP